MAEDDKTRETDERPAFLRALPDDPGLAALAAAFESGDFGRVRAGVPKLLASSKDEAVKQAAADLLARTKPDPMAALLLAFTALLLIVLSAFWVTHDGPK